MTKSFEEMYPTLAVFEAHVRGILKIIKAADIYALHIIAACRNNEVDKNLINKIIKSDAISPLVFDSLSYRDNEIAALKKVGHLKDIGQQIVLATYTALEVYLIEKFKEYYKHSLRDKDSDFIQTLIKRFSFRNIEEIKRHYSKILKIHLPSFEIKCYTTEKCNWCPESTWEAILLIEKTRNQIAHSGQSIDYKIVTLMDAWYPFEFVQDWVRSFDVNFDLLIYKGKENAAIREYKAKIDRQIGSAG